MPIARNLLLTPPVELAIALELHLLGSFRMTVDGSETVSIPKPAQLLMAKLATAAAGLVGTLVVFGVAWGMARILPHSPNIEATPDAV